LAIRGGGRGFTRQKCGGFTSPRPGCLRIPPLADLFYGFRGLDEGDDAHLPVALESSDRAKPKTALDSAAAALLFGIAILAIDRTITAWLERNFAFLLAF